MIVMQLGKPGSILCSHDGGSGIRENLTFTNFTIGV